MLKNHFPMRVVAYDADGIQRNVACLQDIVDLAQEKVERYNDEEAKRFLSELVSVTGKKVVSASKELDDINAERKAAGRVPARGTKFKTAAEQSDATAITATKKPAPRAAAAKAPAKKAVAKPAAKKAGGKKK